MDIVGWKEAATKAATLAAEHNSEHLWVLNWADASRIAWYAYPAKLQVADDKMNQFEVWNGYPQGSSTALLTLPKRIKDGRTPATTISVVANNQCTLIDELSYAVDSVEVNVFWFYLCRPTTAD